MPSRLPLLLPGLLALVLPAVALERAAKAPDLPAPATGDWPWWRGPALDGTSRDRSPPLRWSATENVVWKTAVPGRGHSSPVVRGERVFLTTADEEAGTQSALAFDRKSGKLLWTTVVHKGRLPRKNPKNSHASATVACDGKRIFCAFVTDEALHVSALDEAGKVLWRREVGPFKSQHGYGASPVLHGDLVIVANDSLGDCSLAGLERMTGKVVWRTERKATGRNGNYGTPIVANVAGKPQLILTGLGETCSYDPEGGKLLWWCAGPAEVTGCTAACSDRLVFASGGFPEKNLLAIRADGRGDVTATHVAWKTTRGVTYVPSPLYHDGKLYVVNDIGVATCFEGATGKEVWQGRLGGAFTSSPVLAGGKLYVTSEAGKTYVLEAGPKFAVAATNDVGEGVLASPAFCGGQVFLRTGRHLFCIGK